MGFQGERHGLEGTSEDISGHFRQVKVKTDSSKSCKSFCVPVISNIRVFPNKNYSKHKIKLKVVKFKNINPFVI